MAAKKSRRRAPASPRRTDESSALRESLLAAGVSAEILDALDAAADPGALLAQLTGSESALSGLIGGFAPLLERGTDPLTAEVSGYQFLAAMRAAPNAPADPAEHTAMLTDLTADVGEHGGPAALAMLRVLAAIGPEPVRPAATEAADRLAAAGLKDRPWVRGLGAPVAGTAFGHGDDLGAQEAVAVTFRYGRREHALAVLIDHDLGGGIKDCWVSPDTAMIHDGYRQAAMTPGVSFRQYTTAEAADILRRALDRPACPRELDQIEDIGIYLDLVRSRVALLPAGPAPAGPARPGVRARGGTVHRIKVTIRGTKPPIWRRLEVPSGIPLHRLHQVMQTAFGWEDYHMWAFETTTGTYGRPDPELGHRSAASKKLVDVAPAGGAHLRYTYDFGDNWEHDILVEEVLPARPGLTYPRCVTGRRAGPPEDCGGVWGYADLLEILADPGHEEHADRLQWLGLASAADHDPAHVDIDSINAALSGLPSGR